MAKFTVEQSAAVAAIHQVIHEWGNELDINSGLEIAKGGIVTDDVSYFVGGEWREGLAATAQFYQDRMARLLGAGGAPVMRHIISNLRISFSSANEAKADYLLLFFAKTGQPPFVGYCDPLAVADVRMECRRDADGDWKISRFDSGQIFQRG